MNYSTQNMGLAFVPFTFPTTDVLFYLHQNVPSINWKLKMVDVLYREYKDLVKEKGFKPYPDKEIVPALVDATGYDLGTTRLFMYSIYQMSKQGRLDPKYLNQSDSGTIFKEPFKDITDTLEKTGKSIKWVGILAITGAVLYFGWPILSKIRKRIK